MPVISKIRFTNVIYEGGSKRYNDELFLFDGHNSAILLENGGGKTVFIQTALQAILPHTDMAGRRIRETLSLSGTPAHIAIEWILNDSPRRYALTAVTLFIHNDQLDSLRYVFEYDEGSPHSIENLPFAKEGIKGKSRPADKGEMQEYYASMSAQYLNAHTFDTKKEYHAHVETHFQIIPREWHNIAVINSTEGGVENFFDDCKTTDQLVSQLLIPAVEQGIDGNNGDAFAEIFEKQREQFKMSKQLRSQIQECKLLEAQIQQYSNVFSQYDKAKALFEREKEWSKALFNQAKIEHVQTQDELALLENQLSNTNEELWVIERKKASRNIALQEHVWQESVLEWKREKEQLDEKQKELDQLEHQQYSLEFARFNAKRREAAEKKGLAETQLKALDEEQDIAHIIDEVEKTKREIRGFYTDAEKVLKQEETYLRSQMTALLDQRKHKQAESEQERSNIEKKKQGYAAIQQQLEQTARQMDKIAHKILDNPLRESVEESITVWQGEIEKTMTTQQLYLQHIHDCEKQTEYLTEWLEEAQKDVAALQEQYNRWNMKCTEAEQQQEAVMADVKIHFPRLGYLDSLYTKQETVKQMVTDKVALLEREKEETMQQERVATRLSDDYLKSAVFLADPELAALVGKWKDAFHYLETGTQFLQETVRQNGELSLDSQYERFPYWAALLITTETEIEQVVHRVKKHADQLRNPVFVMSLQEVKELLESPETYTNKFREIIPAHWRCNLNEDQFASWKLEIQKRAEEVVQLRKQKEKEYQQLLQLNSQVLRFIFRYPQEEYREWKQQRDRLLEKENDLQKEIAKRKADAKKYETEWKAYKDKLSDEMNREQHLAYRIQDAKEYLLLKQEREVAKKTGDEITFKIEQLQRQFTQFVRSIQILEEQIEEFRNEMADKRNELAKLQGEWLYQHVAAYLPLSPRYSLERMRTELEGLEALLRKQQSSRTDLEKQIERYRNEILEHDNAMEIIQTKVSQPLEPNARFPLDGSAQLQRLAVKMKQLKSELSTLRENAEKLHSQAAGAGVLFENMKKQFAEKFTEQEIDEFADNLEDVWSRLEQEEKAATSRKEYLHAQEKRFQHAIKEIDEVIRKLEIKNESYSFLTLQVQDISLTEDDALTFTYQRMRITLKRLYDLEEKHLQAEKEFKRVGEEKARFKRFCENSIHNIKLQKTAIAGIENKHEFVEVEDWAGNMSKTIAASIRILEDNLQGRDKELQDFITIVHTHLQRIAIEMLTIPKKTSVKIDSGRKEIFHFHVPEWKEEVGKQLLRNHIDWMLLHLDHENFKDMEGNDDLGKIKKFILTSLQSKSLLGIVMGSDSIRVKCRKVSRDGRVSGALSSWEESNKWSGGEKWSKNMTLFLGILNYLAEKRQHIAQHGKRYRTVIVDNPFGKASSEHVLDPVFFIADELGFQLIALTAHAEGKFIRDYFPIVYSCRLRESTSGDVLIMTKEREIRQAYFRDYDPVALIRLSEHEQLSFL
ncbi:hypothetical protein [uncultured Brevibacillus sp.]|uniref:hypothetical protein n=1 Tax=uncultured Brevibacillus sp. TaxID=169970 RepID=UPI00259A111F|nr:hypothetical protein [uncultured Brevibacillus sp.]